MLQITVADVSLLTKDQREHLAGFILTYPPVPAGIDTNVILPLPSATATADNETEEDPAKVFPLSSGPQLVPSTPSAVPQAPTNGSVDLDKDGLPWDERIHASSRAKTAEGYWRAKRGVEKDVVTQVEAELRRLMAIPSPVVPPVPTVPEAPVVPQVPTAPEVPAVPVAPTPLNETPAPTAPAPSADGISPRDRFIAFVHRVTDLVENQKKLSHDEVKQICKEAGIEEFKFLATRLDLVPTVEAAVNATIFGR